MAEPDSERESRWKRDWFRINEGVLRWWYKHALPWWYRLNGHALFRPLVVIAVFLLVFFFIIFIFSLIGYICPNPCNAGP
ncbi:MAG TPA: hypothetical protein VGS11_13680 [Candidatus Bathyarchaeia archaeon]|nr:hypothetical protein [Candidatus Bathyarchaeia archaeon]